MKARKNHSKFIYETFGEPIGDAPSCSGVADDRADDGDLICDTCGGMLEMEGAECSQCGMMPVSMGLDEEDDLDEVTPPGYEKVVKGLKSDKSVDNPWAVAWSMKKKGIGPKKESVSEAFDPSSLDPADQKRIARLQKMTDAPIVSVSGTPGKKGVTHVKVQGKKGVYLWNPHDFRWEFIPS